MTRALYRSIPFWTLFVASIALVAAGAKLVLDRISTMSAAFTSGNATGVDVYVGQSWIMLGATLLGAGVLGILFTLVLLVVSAIVPAAKPVQIDSVSIDDAGPEHNDDAVRPSTSAPRAHALREDEESSEGQNGSSGSTATATKISVK